MITALAVKVIQVTSPRTAMSAEKEVQALKAVRGRKHILQYVHHSWSAARDKLLVSTRCVMLFTSLEHRA